jgi:prolyl oligopeptidase
MSRASWTLASILLAAATCAVAAAAQSDVDPNLWLSEIHGAKALEWVKERTAKSDALLKSDPAYKLDYDAILDALNRNDRIPVGRLDHGDVYNFWQDADHVRGIWRRTTISDYANASPNWELLLDVDKLDADEHANFVWQGEDCAPGGEHCLVRLSPGGGDATTVREFDLKTKSFMKDGFSLSLSKLSASYVDADTVLFGTNFGPGTMTKSSYPRILKLWHRGQPVAAAKTVFEARTTDIAARPFVFRGPYGTIALVDRGVTFFTSDFFYLRPEGGTVRLPLPLGANIQGVTQGALIFKTREAWIPRGESKPYGAGSLIAFPVAPFVSGKTAHFVLLSTPGPRSTIDTVSAGRDAVYAAIFTNVTGTVHEFRPRPNGTWSDTRLALPQGGSTTVVATNDWGPEAHFTFESFLTPPTLFAYDGAKPPASIKSQHAVFDASGHSVEQFWTVSKDKTRVPYFLIRAKDAHGPVPTILYSYGGFELSLTPWYWNDGHRPLYPGAPWLAKGGAIVVANIRGGGEFGPKWHQATLKFNHQRAFDDFEAVAMDIERRGIATPDKVGIVGASNGGLLVTAAMTQRPELFKAVVCQRPLIDMLRYTQFGAGASWADEYGDPADPKMRAYIAKYSPYQNVRAGVKYPDLLLITETSDDRVTPIWARMMAAKMEGQGHNVLFNESIEGGHGPGSTNAAQAEMWALSYAYLGRELGLGAAQH